MSDSKKLRITYGVLWLILSYFLFAVSTNLIWILFTFLRVPLYCYLAVMIIGLLFVFSLISVDKACKYFIGITKEEIDKSDFAKLKKLYGIIELVISITLFIALICIIWLIALFSSLVPDIELLAIPAMFFFFGFIILIASACSNFMAIEEQVKK